MQYGKVPIKSCWSIVVIKINSWFGTKKYCEPRIIALLYTVGNAMVQCSIYTIGNAAVKSLGTMSIYVCLMVCLSLSSMRRADLKSEE